MSVMTLLTDVDATGMVHLDLPSPVKRGRVQVRVEIQSADTACLPATAADLLASPLKGLWRNRDDITDSVAFARDLRKRGERRGDR